jgi:hypothetical protein
MGVEMEDDVTASDDVMPELEATNENEAESKMEEVD